MRSACSGARRRNRSTARCVSAGCTGSSKARTRTRTTAVDPIAKLRNQLLRRPWGTVGLVFTTTRFTAPAVLMTHFALPQPLLLWTGAEVAHAIEQTKVCAFALEKYRACVEHGMVDWNVTT